MSGRRLGIDLDGVVADFNSGWIERYNAEFGAELALADVTMWNAPVGLTHFASMGEFWSWAETCGDGASLFRVLEPYPEAVETLQRLARRDTIVIVTTKPHFARRDTFAWLEDHRVPASEVHIVDAKHEIACDVYLDDADHNLRSIRVARPEALVVRYVRPWNRAHEGVVDVEEWAQFERLLTAP
jgi:5'(3')-deoxyribonucleotidase